MPTTRRTTLKALAALGTLSATGAAESAAPAPDDALASLIDRTPLIDTHEHLPDEDERLRGERIACDDCFVLFSHYIDSDLVASGMSDDTRGRILSRNTDPAEKWRLLAPHWPAVKNTGYGRAVRIAIKELYGIDELSDGVIGRLQQAYESTRKPGFYRKLLVETANIESCQVNYLGKPFKESKDPTLLMQDISIVGMHMGPDIKTFASAAGKEVKDLANWHEVIRWWFDKYAPYAVAVKSQAAYSRGLDYDQVPAEKAEPVFKRLLAKEPVSAEDRKLLEDHLFWFAVEQATKHRVPVKLHTGYYAGHNRMPLGRVSANPAQAAELCRKSRDTAFIFMHIAYPYWQDLVAVAKQYSNAHIDMCWAWIIDPVASTEFLKSYLMAAPANKVLTFGGDYIPVECVVGHAKLARQGIHRALSQLVQDNYLSLADAVELVEPLLRGNARKIFQVEAKARQLAKAPWL